ncbi:GerAB/ArcD/ProY family transporter [Bacillus sp. FJAT-45037]|uniref:GerAB/ArcD/ProY family transporter n=1 Tax=Bacillus sp. FJAT-45037 TaxID=2011007 RepID=UPI0012FDA276|nr:endospore germination permease [Bacillus sp. FJAT-45037]
MSKLSKSTITPGQMGLFVLQTQVGVGVLSMPYSVFDAGAKTDGWISIILAGFVVQVMIFVFMFLSMKFPKANLYDILIELFGQWIGKFLILVHVIYFISLGVLILILFSSTLSVWAFPHTPQLIKIGLACFTAYYLAKESVRIIARFHSFVSILLILIVLLTVTAFTNAEFRYILPIGQAGFSNIATGVKAAMLSLVGFELFIILFAATEGTLKVKVKVATIVNVAVTLVYTYLAIACYVFFSPDEMAFVPEPILYLIKSFSFIVLERIDLIFISIWIVAVMTSFVSYLYISSIGVARVMNKKKHAPFTAIIAVICFVLSVSPHNLLTVEKITQIVGNGGLIFSFLIPVTLLLLALVLKRQKKPVATNEKGSAST